MSAVEPVEAVVAHSTEATRSPGALRRLARKPVAMGCLIYIAVLVLVAIIAPMIWPDIDRELAGDLARANELPSADHLLGTDSLGRDLLQRLLVGTRVTLIGVVEGLVVVLAIGVPLGVIAGYFGGVVDRVLGWISDLMFSVPGLMIILVVLSIFKLSLLAAMVTFGILVSPHVMRLVRSATLPVSQELYIDAARVAGLSRTYILARHVLPRVAGPIIVQASFLAAAILLVQSGLAYLNLIIPAPAPSWGGMIAEGIQQISGNPWLIWPPGVVIALTMLAFLLLSDEVRDLSVETWRGAAPGARRRKHVVTTTPKEQAVLDDVELATDALLSVRELTVTVEKDSEVFPIIQSVTLDVRPGETVGIVGESGCGKTMTAMAILGLLGEGAKITGGQVLFEGMDLAAMSERELLAVRGAKIGLISQEPMVGFNPVFRVGTQLEDCLRLHRGMSRREARGAAIELLKRVRLPDPEAVARRYPHELSGGMAQRVSIARALTGEPLLLIADEPTTALDVTVQAEILDLLRSLARERGMAVLLVSHDWGVVADLCDRAVVMYAGQVVERAAIAPIFAEPLHPYTEALLASNPHHVAAGEPLPTIPGSVPRPGAWPVGCHFQSRCRFATDACREAPIPISRPVPERETRCIHVEALLDDPSSALAHSLEAQ